MSQNDFNIANQGFPATRADINSALQALASTSAGATEPGTIYAYQLWYDTSTNLLKMRNADNDAWITLAAFDQAADEWEVRTAVVQAVDSAGVVIKTDDGVARISIADSGAVTVANALTVGGNLTVDTNTLFVDAANNSVGVGTSSPLAKTNSVSAGAALGGTAQFAIGSGTNNFENTYFRIDDSGNSNFCIDQIVSSTSFNRLFIERTTGNVGIGETSPDAKLHIRDATDGGSGSVTSAIQFSRRNGGANDAAIKMQHDGSDGISNLQFHFGASEVMRILNTGLVAIGQSNPGNAKLEVKGSIVPYPTTGLLFVNGDTAGDVGSCAAAFSKFDNNNTTSQVFIRFGIGQYATGGGQINANGASQAAFGAFSDSRLKENITDLPSQLNNIMSLRPVEFDYIQSEGGGHQIGFVAQEMQQVYPDAVGERAPDGMLTVTGWNKTEARLVKALQEAVQKIEALEARITALEV